MHDAILSVGVCVRYVICMLYMCQCAWFVGVDWIAVTSTIYVCKIGTDCILPSLESKASFTPKPARWADDWCCPRDRHSRSAPSSHCSAGSSRSRRRRRWPTDADPRRAPSGSCWKRRYKCGHTVNRQRFELTVRWICSHFARQIFVRKVRIAIELDTGEYAHVSRVSMRQSFNATTMCTSVNSPPP